jgi:predicted  nucleic acid-binding Zn-ribbon protein
MDVSVLVSTVYLSVFGAAFGWLILRRIDRLEHRIDGLQGRIESLESRVERVEGRFEGLMARIEALEAQVAALRTDLTQIALAVGARLRPETG